jgi:hypothetical protein
VSAVPSPSRSRSSCQPRSWWSRSATSSSAPATLAEEARRILAERLGLPASSSAELVADTVAARTGIDRGRVLEALATTTGISDKDLVSRSQTIEEIRREVTRVR